MKKLTELEIQAGIATLNGWSINENGIIKTFEFQDFKETLSIMNQIGKVAEEMNHHPEWFNVYNKLDIRLSTHDFGGITQSDMDLAKAIEEIVNN